MNSALFKSMADQSLMGFVVWAIDNTNTLCLYANPMALQTFQATDPGLLELEKICPGAGSSVGSSEIKFRSFSKDLLQHEGLFQNVLLRKLSGVNFVGSCGVRHLQVEGRPCVLIMVQDTTVQVKLQREVENKQNQIRMAYEELLQQNKQLKELDIAKNRFIALVTHELRTPASAVVATAEALKMGVIEGPDQTAEFMGMIYDEGRRLLELINDILDFAKIQANKMDYYIESQALEPVLKRVQDSLKPLAEGSEVTLHPLQLPPNLPMAYFDALRLGQVITNIVSNAIKYNRKGGSVHMTCEALPEGPVRVHIRDTGHGISTENRSRIFNEFETLGKISAHTRGTGLGLPISKKMLEAMGGVIEFTSVEGKGSDFWIDIPTTQVLGLSEHYRSRPDDDQGDLAA
jgi:signal transduction histidine kinase